ncbi:immunity protein YezG family protein [Pseudomonas alkylphenolica]|nr:immunity protein YezG family protein [Pseudomonas alkylphenolica]
MQHKLPTQEEVYTEIGQSLLDAVPDDFEEAWVRTEMIEDVWSIGVFYKKPQGTYGYIGGVNEELEESLRVLWQIYKKDTNAAWTTATFHLTKSFEMSLDLGYEDISDFGLNVERREAWILKYLGESAEID